VVAVEGFQDARETDPARGGHRPVRRVHHLGARDRQAGRVEEPVGQALVRRDVHGDPEVLEVIVALIRC